MPIVCLPCLSSANMSDSEPSSAVTTGACRGQGPGPPVTSTAAAQVHLYTCFSLHDAIWGTSILDMRRDSAFSFFLGHGKLTPLHGSQGPCSNSPPCGSDVASGRRSGSQSPSVSLIRFRGDPQAGRQESQHAALPGPSDLEVIVFLCATSQTLLLSTLLSPPSCFYFRTCSFALPAVPAFS